MKYASIVLLALIGCGQSGTAGEEIVGIKEEFADTPGLVRTEVVDAAGRLASVGYYLNGKKEGAWTDYTEDDRVHRLTSYVGGKKEGVYMEFSTTNQVTVRCYFHNDQRHGKYVEYTSSSIREERYYANGKLEGIARK